MGTMYNRGRGRRGDRESMGNMYRNKGTGEVTEGREDKGHSDGNKEGHKERLRQRRILRSEVRETRTQGKEDERGEYRTCWLGMSQDHTSA